MKTADLNAEQAEQDNKTRQQAKNCLLEVLNDFNGGAFKGMNPPPMWNAIAIQAMIKFQKRYAEFSPAKDAKEYLLNWVNKKYPDTKQTQPYQIALKGEDVVDLLTEFASFASPKIDAEQAFKNHSKEKTGNLHYDRIIEDYEFLFKRTFLAGINANVNSNSVTMREAVKELMLFVEDNGDVVNGYRSREIITKLKSALSSYPDKGKDKWIPVEKELPPHQDYVLVHTKFGNILKAYWVQGLKFWKSEDGSEIHTVTHWQP